MRRALPLSAPAYEVDWGVLARAHDPAWALVFIQRLVEQERALLARLDQIEAGALRLLGLFPVEGGSGRPGRPVPGGGRRGRRGRRRFLAAAAAVAAGDQAPSGGAAVLDRRLRLGRAARERRRAPARRAGPRRRGLRAEGALRRPALLRPRAPARRPAAAALPAGRRQRLDARRARGLRARAGAGAGQEAVAGGGAGDGDLAALLRQPAAPAPGSGAGRPARSAAAASDFAPSGGGTTRASSPTCPSRWPGSRARRGRQVAITFITHGACHIPVPTVQALAANAQLYGIFVLPSRPLELDYLPLPAPDQVVTAASLARAVGQAPPGAGDRRRRGESLMPDRDKVQARVDAERALRGGRAREALELYKGLLRDKSEGRRYERWLDGAASAYVALGRTREAGYTLMGLRRFADAQRHFPVAEHPLDWALCAARLGRHGEAARVLSEVGHPALAAIELEAAGAGAAARLEWERVLRDPRLAGSPLRDGAGPLQSGRGAAAHRRARRRGRVSSTTRGGCWRRSPTTSSRGASTNAPSIATGCCCGWGRTSGRSRTSPRGT